MARQTSIWAFYDNFSYKKSLRSMIFDIICQNYGISDREIMAMLEKKGVKWSSQPKARRNELLKMGLISEVGKRKCTISQKTVLIWGKKCYF